MTYKNIELPKGIKKQTISFIQGIIDLFETEQKLNELDSLSLYLLASNVDSYLECERNIRKNGAVYITDRGNQAASAYVGIQKQAMSAIIALLKELGLTISSRSKIKAVDNAGDDSPLLSFLKGDGI